MESLKDRVEKHGLRMDILNFNALEIAKSFASSGGDRVDANSVVVLYKDMINAQIEVYEEKTE